VGQTLVNVPTQTLIADRVDVDVQGRVYGAHFAWSHFWWAFSYPLAGWLGGHFSAWAFLGSGLIGVALWGVAHFLWQPARHAASNGLWHDHEHRHDELHQHAHRTNGAATAPHRHLHFHLSLSPDHL